MIYTIGGERTYTRYFKEQGRPLKFGRIDGYSGGVVWKTEEEARKHCSEGYQVYGVLADWEKHTEPSKDGDGNDLLVTAELVQLDTIWD